MRAIFAIGCEYAQATGHGLGCYERVECGAKRMSRELYACVHAAEFPARALMRMRPDLRSEPIAVFEVRPPQETVCSLNRNSRLQCRVSCGDLLGVRRCGLDAADRKSAAPRCDSKALTQKARCRFWCHFVL
jgi:hypothetical protein